MIVTSTALIKSRLNNAYTVVKDLMSGTKKPDKIYFFISEKPHNIDEGIKPHEIPVIDNPKVEFVYTDNIGSLRKIVPILKMYWNRPSTQIVLYDDDWRIPKDSLSSLINFQQDIHHRFYACGISGNIYRKSSGGIMHSKYVDGIGRSVEFSWELKQPRQVDLLSSGLGLLIKPKFFTEHILNWEQYKDYGVTQTDEHFINYMLALKGTPRWVVTINKCPSPLNTPSTLSFAKDTPKFKGKQSQAWHKKIMEWRL